VCCACGIRLVVFGLWCSGAGWVALVVFGCWMGCACGVRVLDGGVLLVVCRTSLSGDLEISREAYQVGDSSACVCIYIYIYNCPGGLFFLIFFHPVFFHPGGGPVAHRDLNGVVEALA